MLMIVVAENVVFGFPSRYWLTRSQLRRAAAIGMCPLQPMSCGAHLFGGGERRRAAEGAGICGGYGGLDGEGLAVTSKRCWAGLSTVIPILLPMSDDQLKTFLEAVKADASLQENLSGMADVDAVVAIAKEAGFEFSAEAVEALRCEIAEKLPDQELVAVAGGWLNENDGDNVLRTLLPIAMCSSLNAIQCH